MELAQRQGDGASLRQHLQRLCASTGKLDPRLEVPEIPAAVRPLWDAYAHLAATRRSGGMGGMHPLTQTDIASWCYLQRVTLTPWEVDTLIEIDAAALAASAAPAAGH